MLGSKRTILSTPLIAQTGSRTQTAITGLVREPVVTVIVQMGKATRSVFCLLEKCQLVRYNSPQPPHILASTGWSETGPFQNSKMARANSWTELSTVTLQDVSFQSKIPKLINSSGPVHRESIISECADAHSNKQEAEQCVVTFILLIKIRLTLWKSITSTEAPALGIWSTKIG